MKIEWNSKYKTISVYTIITATIITMIVLFFINLQYFGNALLALLGILAPFMVGFAAAYLLYRPASFIERCWFGFVEHGKPRPGLRRALSIFTLFVIIFGIFMLLVYFIIPQLFANAALLVRNIPLYLTELEDGLTGWLQSINLYTPEVQQSIVDFQSTFLNFTTLLNTVMSELPKFISTVSTGLFNFFVGMIVCVYVLYSRERFLRQTKKLIYSIFKKEFAYKFMGVFKYSNDVFLGFIMGTLISCVFVGASTFIFMSIAHMPYALLISVLVGVMNVVPFFGPFLGAIPSVIILFMVDPFYALLFIIFTLILQQVDGNIILPKLIGMNVGVSAFWVLFALLLGGGLFGFWGLVLGVPVFAVIYSLISTLINNTLKRKAVPEEEYNSPHDIVETEPSTTYGQKREERAKKAEERKKRKGKD